MSSSSSAVHPAVDSASMPYSISSSVGRWNLEANPQAASPLTDVLRSRLLALLSDARLSSFLSRLDAHPLFRPNSPSARLAPSGYAQVLAEWILRHPLPLLAAVESRAAKSPAMLVLTAHGGLSPPAASSVIMAFVALVGNFVAKALWKRYPGTILTLAAVVGPVRETWKVLLEAAIGRSLRIQDATLWLAYWCLFGSLHLSDLVLDGRGKGSRKAAPTWYHAAKLAVLGSLGNSGEARVWTWNKLFLPLLAHATRSPSISLSRPNPLAAPKTHPRSPSLSTSTTSVPPMSPSTSPVGIDRVLSSTYSPSSYPISVAIDEQGLHIPLPSSPSHFTSSPPPLPSAPGASRVELLGAHPLFGHGPVTGASAYGTLAEDSEYSSGGEDVGRREGSHPAKAVVKKVSEIQPYGMLGSDEVMGGNEAWPDVQRVESGPTYPVQVGRASGKPPTRGPVVSNMGRYAGGTGGEMGGHAEW